MADYSTIALYPEQKDGLDKVNEREFDGKATYREVVEYLLDEHQNQRDSFDEVVRQALLNLDDRDINRILRRLENDAEWVAEVDTEE